MVICKEIVTVEESVPPKDASIGIGRPAKGPPQGFVVLPENEKTPAVGQVAKSLLGGEFGTTTPFTIDGHQFMARVEPHYHQPPPAGTPPEEQRKYPKPWGWHKGVTVYKSAKPTVEDYMPEPAENPRIKFLQRIDQLYQELGVKLN